MSSIADFDDPECDADPAGDAAGTGARGRPPADHDVHRPLRRVAGPTAPALVHAVAEHDREVGPEQLL